MYQNIQQKDRVIFNSNVVSIEQTGAQTTLYNNKKEKICEADYVILANGFNSHIRDSLGIKMQG